MCSCICTKLLILMLFCWAISLNFIWLKWSHFVVPMCYTWTSWIFYCFIYLCTPVKFHSDLVLLLQNTIQDFNWCESSYTYVIPSSHREDITTHLHNSDVDPPCLLYWSVWLDSSYWCKFSLFNWQFCFTHSHQIL